MDFVSQDISIKIVKHKLYTAFKKLHTTQFYKNCFMLFYLNFIIASYRSPVVAKRYCKMWRNRLISGLETLMADSLLYYYLHT